MENQTENHVSEVKRSRGFSIASLVLGIVSLIVFAFITGSLAIIFGILGINKEGKNGMAITGIVLGVIGILAAIVLIAIWQS